MVSVVDVSGDDVSVLSGRKARGGGEGAADTALKTKTPHDNVGNKRNQLTWLFCGAVKVSNMGGSPLR